MLTFPKAEFEYWSFACRVVDQNMKYLPGGGNYRRIVVGITMNS